jgi:hypothetical protein
MDYDRIIVSDSDLSPVVHALAARVVIDDGLQVMGARRDGLEGGQVLENGSPEELLANSSGM